MLCGQHAESGMVVLPMMRAPCLGAHKKKEKRRGGDKTKEKKKAGGAAQSAAAAHSLVPPLVLTKRTTAKYSKENDINQGIIVACGYRQLSRRAHCSVLVSN